MLAYLFWHRPRSGVDPDSYEDVQRGFHRELGTESACFRLSALPFGEGGGYEDWYLVEDWNALGRLNVGAVDERRRKSHDAAALLANDGWGGVYSLARGAPEIPIAARWLDKPRGEPSEEFVATLPGGPIWRRQLVLGPAPEFCIASPQPMPGREPIWPATGGG